MAKPDYEAIRAYLDDPDKCEQDPELIRVRMSALTKSICGLSLSEDETAALAAMWKIHKNK